MLMHILLYAEGGSKQMFQSSWARIMQAGQRQYTLMSKRCQASFGKALTHRDKGRGRLGLHDSLHISQACLVSQQPPQLGLCRLQLPQGLPLALHLLLYC